MCAKCIPVPFLWSLSVKHTHTPVQHRIVSVVMVCAVLVNAAISAHIRLVYTYVNIHTRKCNITPLLLLKGLFFFFITWKRMNQKKHKKAEGEQRVENVFFPFHHLKKKHVIFI